MSKERITRRSLASPRNWTADWSSFDAKTDADIEAAVNSDPDAAPLADEDWFKTATVVEPATKQAISLRIDRDMLEWFRTNSDRYQTKMNAVLRAYVEHEQKRRA